MSIIPAKGVTLDFYEGSTFDETWTFYEDDEITLLDLSGWDAAMKVRKTYDAATAAISLAGVALAVGPNASGIEMGGVDGTVRVYIGSTIMAALDEAEFTAVTLEDGSTQYQGVWDLELINPGGEVFRYAMGTAIFWPEATY